PFASVIEFALIFARLAPQWPPSEESRRLPQTQCAGRGLPLKRKSLGSFQAIAEGFPKPHDLSRVRRRGTTPHPKSEKMHCTIAVAVRRHIIDELTLIAREIYCS